MKEIGYDTVINNIKSIINEKGIKQSFIAKKIGFSDGEFSNVLNNRRKLLRVEHLPLIAEALDVNINDLYCYQKEQKEAIAF